MRLIKLIVYTELKALYYRIITRENSEKKNKLFNKLSRLEYIIKLTEEIEEYYRNFKTFLVFQVNFTN